MEIPIRNDGWAEVCHLWEFTGPCGGYVLGFAVRGMQGVDRYALPECRTFGVIVGTMLLDLTSTYLLTRRNCNGS